MGGLVRCTDGVGTKLARSPDLQPQERGGGGGGEKGHQVDMSDGDWFPDSLVTRPSTSEEGGGGHMGGKHGEQRLWQLRDDPSQARGGMQGARAAPSLQEERDPSTRKVVST